LALERRVIVFRVVNSNQILRHDFSYNGLLPWGSQPHSVAHCIFIL
jgi:hypothetical protein